MRSKARLENEFELQKIAKYLINNMLSEARQKQIKEKLYNVPKCLILGPQNLGWGSPSGSTGGTHPGMYSCLRI